MEKKQTTAAEAYRAVRQNAQAIALMQRFSSAAVPEVRLALALYGYFHGVDLRPAQRGLLGAYLRANMEAAAQTMVELGLPEELEQSWELGWLNREIVDSLLQSAIGLRKTELTVWLLHLKRKAYGFPDRDLSFERKE